MEHYEEGGWTNPTFEAAPYCCCSLNPKLLRYQTGCRFCNLQTQHQQAYHQHFCMLNLCDVKLMVLNTATIEIIDILMRHHQEAAPQVASRTLMVKWLTNNNYVCSNQKLRIKLRKKMKATTRHPPLIQDSCTFRTRAKK